MSLIPWNNNNTTATTNNNNNTLDYWNPFPQHIWDQFFNFPTFPFKGPTPTVPYTELGVETTGSVRAKVECREVEEAHLVVAELSGVEKHEVDVTTEDGGILSITGGEGDRRFSWRMKMPEDANVGMLSWSMENSVITVVVPKVGAQYVMQGWDWGNSGRTNRRQIEIQGFD
ncbi:18.0 kDa class I heat shock protein-like [Silene latifolia]|uniref:18.0 kDa class I heat shock protein-like n=1 Tax=Silene latifolia TaxID=37657 RepID=UPI003D789903